MEAKHKYKNRSQELERLINILRNVGISHTEELTKLLVRAIQGYALQTGIEPLTKYELEYVWLKLLD
jgi:hypothetical protein